MRYSVEIIAKGRHGMAYVNDAEAGDVARAFDGPDAASNATAEAERLNAVPTFDRIAAGHYRNAETGIEIVKVSADEAGRGWAGWIVTVPLRGLSFETTHFGKTKASVMADAVEQVVTMRAVMADDFAEALTAAAKRDSFFAQQCDEDEAWAASDVTWRRTLEQDWDEAAAEDARRLVEWDGEELAEQATCTKADGWLDFHAFESEPIALDSDGYDEWERCGKPASALVHMQEAGFRVGDRIVFGTDVWQVSELRINSGTGRPALSLVDPANPNRWTSVYESAAVEWAEAEAHREYAARIIEAARAPEGATGPGLPPVPDDLDDDEAWAAYCAALPEPTEDEIADVLAEYGDPYTALRAEAVEGFKSAARMIWRIRFAQRVAGATADRELITFLRKQMRTFRGVVEVYDQLAETWRAGVRADAARDSYTEVGH